MNLLAPRSRAVVGPAVVHGVDEPVIQRPVVLEFQRADGVRNPLDGILEAVRPVVHRIDGPAVALAMVRLMHDPIHNRVPHVQIGMRHIDLGPQRVRAIGELALAHPLEQLQILLDSAIAIRAFPAGLGQRAAILAHLVAGQVADVRFTLADQLDRPFIHLPEVIGAVKEPVVPVAADPPDVLDDGIDVLLLFLLRVGVVEAQVELAAELLGDAVVQADALGVANVQIAVRLRREPRRHPSAPFARPDIVRHDLPDEVQPPFPAAFFIPVRPVAR
jgi:hypothetical protein